MQYPRSYHNLTLLPDGSVLATGGGTMSDGVDLTKAVLPAEIWNPDTETWTTVAAEQNGRLYHSTAHPAARRPRAHGRRRTAPELGLPSTSTTVRSTRRPISSREHARRSPPHRHSPRTGATFTVTTPDAARIAVGLADPHAGRDARVRPESALPAAELQPDGRRRSRSRRRPTRTWHRPATTCSSSSTRTASRRSHR